MHVGCFTRLERRIGTLAMRAGTVGQRALPHEMHVQPIRIRAITGTLQHVSADEAAAVALVLGLHLRSSEFVPPVVP